MLIHPTVERPRSLGLAAELDFQHWRLCAVAASVPVRRTIVIPRPRLQCRDPYDT